MRDQLPIWWLLWWLGATILALAFLVISARRRRALTNKPETAGLALPTTREDLLWTGLVVLVGAGGLGLIFLLLAGAHTARALLVAAIFGVVMLLGLLMLLKNGLAPTDSIQFDPSQVDRPEENEPEDLDDLDPMRISQKHLRIRTNSGGFGSVVE